MAKIKYKDKNGEWKELTIIKGDSGVAPIINPNTNTWLVWDDVEGAYIDSGVVAGVGTQDFVDSTYWVFNEMTSGKKVIADALTNRNYPTDKSESFNDMAQKINDMSYGLGIFEKIGYTEKNNDVTEKVNYAYEVAKGWNNDGSTAQMFRGNKQLVFAPMVDTSQCSSLADMFYGCIALSTIPQFDTSNVTNMNSMFYGCTALTIIPELDTRNATNMAYMFYGCSALSTIPQFDTSNVTNMNSMFYGCTALTIIPELDTRNATNMSQMTREANALIRIEGIYLNKVTSHQFAYNNHSIVFAKFYNLGMSSLVTHDFSRMSNWGTGGEENRQSLIDSLITYSYDRASNGMSTATIKLSDNTKASLTEEEIAQITAKGFTIA